MFDFDYKIIKNTLIIFFDSDWFTTHDNSLNKIELNMIIFLINKYSNKLLNHSDISEIDTIIKQIKFSCDSRYVMNFMWICFDLYRRASLIVNKYNNLKLYPYSTKNYIMIHYKYILPKVRFYLVEYYNKVFWGLICELNQLSETEQHQFISWMKNNLVFSELYTTTTANNIFRLESSIKLTQYRYISDLLINKEDINVLNNTNLENDTIEPIFVNNTLDYAFHNLDILINQNREKLYKYILNYYKFFKD